MKTAALGAPAAQSVSVRYLHRTAALKSKPASSRARPSHLPTHSLSVDSRSQCYPSTHLAGLGDLRQGTTVEGNMLAFGHLHLTCFNSPGCPRVRREPAETCPWSSPTSHTSLLGSPGEGRHPGRANGKILKGKNSGQCIAEKALPA